MGAFVGRPLWAPFDVSGHEGRPYNLFLTFRTPFPDFASLNAGLRGLSRQSAIAGAPR